MKNNNNDITSVDKKRLQRSLMKAVKRGDTEKVLELIVAKVDLNIQESFGARCKHTREQGVERCVYNSNHTNEGAAN